VIHSPARASRLAASLVVTVAVFVAAAGCAVKPPSLGSVESRLVVVVTDAEGHREERLSCFASVADADGVSDIEYLYVVHDGSELCWTLTADDWVQKDDGSGSWLGSNGLRSTGGVMPRGSYRAILVDKAGERDERTFMLSAPSTHDLAMPVLVLSGTDIRLDTPCPLNTVFFLDAGGNVVMTAPVTPGITALDALWPKGGWRTGADFMTVYGFDPKAEIGFFAWKKRLRD
jgi:hypothetical protein